MVANIWPMKPSGVQLSRPMRPSVRHTRSSSSAATWWCGANMTPMHDMTTSNEPSSKGSASASASCQVIGSRSPTAARPASSRAGVRSVATTSAPVSAAGIEALPLPAAMSSTRSPGPG